MGFLCGFAGVFLGAIVGGTAAFSLVSVAVDGDGLGVFFLMMIWGPIGLIAGALLGAVLALRVLRYVRGNQQRRHAKRSNILLVSGLILAAPLLAAALAWYGNQCQYPPSDQQLLSNFRFHRAEFDELAQMKQADKGLLSIGSDFTQPNDLQTVGVSPERIAKYRWLLQCAGVHRGLRVDGLTGADFAVWMQGGATSSDRDKGYAHLVVPPKHILSSLNQIPPDSPHEFEVYRHIEGCWYLYYEYLPG